MLLLSAEKIEKSYGIKPLLEGASLYLSRGDKVGVVGLNGMGKSTLLKIIAGVEQYDSGSITKIPHLVIHYLPQQPDMQAGNSAGCFHIVRRTEKTGSNCKRFSYSV